MHRPCSIQQLTGKGTAQADNPGRQNGGPSSRSVKSYSLPLIIHAKKNQTLKNREWSSNESRDPVLRAAAKIALMAPIYRLSNYVLPCNLEVFMLCWFHIPKVLQHSGQMNSQ
jgi:hypothetical protein